MITSNEIKKRLWEGANELRGSMDASRYKDYMLGLMFYKFLSDKTLEAFKSSANLKNLTDEQLVIRYKEASEKYGDNLQNAIQKILGYYVTPEYLYQTWIDDINNGDFAVQKVTDSLNNFERSIVINSHGNDFKGLFSSSTIDLTDTALGSNLNERSKNVQALILLFADLNMVELQDGDILGDAYEYLIGQFAMESGKKAGEFYTPHQVSEVMAQIVAKSSNIETIYDPTVGSGSLLLTVGKHLSLDKRRDLKYYGQELNTATYNLTRMNLLLHGVRPDKMEIRNADTLSYDWPEDPNNPGAGIMFDAVVMNPPYSVKGWNKNDLKVSDPRFEIVGVLPPNSKGDYAFLLHGLYHLGQEGTMAIVLPHGVLFRSAEGEIRKQLIEKNYIDTIIGLPSNLFTNADIPVTVIILKKNRQLNEPILIIDSSENFVKEGKQNVLLEKDIAKIVDTYADRTVEEGFSYLVSRDEIIENDYAMNIPRYVSATNDEIDHDVDAHLLGGIPINNIKSLKILNDVAKDILNNSLSEIRPNYVKLNKSIEDLTNEVLNSNQVKKISNKMKEDINKYTSKYWNLLISHNDQSSIRELRDEMLIEIKDILLDYKYLDAYGGFQIIAKLWEDFLMSDVDKISNGDFYTIAKSREANMVSKGSGKNKRMEQDGWTGALIPNDIIKKELYKEEAEEIEELESQLFDIESQLDELVEAAKIEDSEENEVLFSCLNTNREGEPTNSFQVSLINSELNEYEKDTDEYKMVNNVKDLLSTRTQTTREIRNKEKDLKESIEKRILKLTDSEVEQLMIIKWFGNLLNEMNDLIEEPLKEELDTLKQMNQRYQNTLEDLDQKYKELESNLQSMINDLVVVR